MSINFLRLASIYLSGAMTFLLFYYQKIYFDSENLGNISFLLILASVMDLGIYFDFISEKISSLKRKYIYSLLYSAFLAILIALYFDCLLATVFFTFAVLPTWYIRFTAEYKDLLLYWFLNILILILGIFFKINVIWIYLARGIASNVLFFPRVLAYIKNFVWSPFMFNTVWLYMLVSTVISNIGLILSIISNFSTDNINYYYDKLGLLMFVIFQFFLRMHGEIKSLQLSLWIFLLCYSVSVFLLFNNSFILSRYISDVCVVWMSLKLIREERYIFLINSYFLALIISLLYIFLFRERNPWSISATVSVVLSLILFINNRNHVLSFLCRGDKTPNN